jgi:folate-binding protein YgfZ
VHPEALWLETDAAAIPALLEHLRGLVVADDVRLAALGPAVALLALEGPGAESALTRAAAGGACPAPDAVAPIEIAGASAAISAHGASGERAFRIAVAREAAGAVAEALAEAGRPLGLVAGSAEVFEILRIEAGTPRFGAEVGPDVLPAEAGLETAISFDKGCYIGQEIVARIESRGRVRRRLAGLRLLDGPAPEPGTPIAAGGIPLGAITSGCVSPAHGSCGLGFVRLPWDAPGTGLDVGGRPARTAALPLVRAGGGGGGA